MVARAVISDVDKKGYIIGRGWRLNIGRRLLQYMGEHTYIGQSVCELNTIAQLSRPGILYTQGRCVRIAVTRPLCPQGRSDLPACPLRAHESPRKPSAIWVAVQRTCEYGRGVHWSLVNSRKSCSIYQVFQDRFVCSFRWFYRQHWRTSRYNTHRRCFRIIACG